MQKNIKEEQKKKEKILDGKDKKDSQPQKDPADFDNVLTLKEHLEAILYQFINLYERWSEDRQVAAKQGAAMARLVEKLTEEIRQFALLEQTVKSDIQKSIRTEAENTAVFLGKTIGDSASKQIELTVKTFSEIVSNAQDQLQHYHSNLLFENLKIIGVAILTAMLTSALIVKCFMPPPILPFTENQLNSYHVGQQFLELWPTLSKEKRKWFLDKKNSQSEKEQEE